MPSRALPEFGTKITHVYGPGRVVHAVVSRYDSAYAFMPSPADGRTTPVQQLIDYEGITWERGWTDGAALLAAHALICSR